MNLQWMNSIANMCLLTEALLRMVAPGVGFRDVTLCDVTPLMKLTACLKVGENQKKKGLYQKLSGLSVQKWRPKKGFRRKLSAFSVQINDGDQIN